MLVRDRRIPGGIPSALAAAAVCLALGACGGGGGAPVDATAPAPIADAGPDQVGLAGAIVALDGRGSFAPGGGALSYSWTQTAGPSAPFLTASHSAIPNFVATVVGTYEFELRVSRTAGGASATDRVAVVVIDDASTPVGRPPGAELRASHLEHAAFFSALPPGLAAGAPTVRFAGGVTMLAFVDVVGDPTDDPLPGATIGLLRVDLVVAGGTPACLYVASPPDEPDALEVRFADGSRAPVRAYGLAGSPYALDATRSFDDVAVATYRWRHLSGSLDFASTSPFFEVVPSLVQTYEWELTVTDEEGLVSFPSGLRVPVVAPGPWRAGPPRAEIRPGSGAASVDLAGTTQLVATVGSPVTLDANPSDSCAGGAPVAGPAALVFAWRQTAGPAVTLPGTGAFATFTPSVRGAYAFEAEVTDASGVSDVAHVWVSVAAPGGTAPLAALAPVADPVLPAGGAVTVDLDGTQSVGMPGVTHHWTQVAGAPVLLATPAAGVGRVVLEHRGRYAFELRVFDGFAFSPPATVAFRAR